MQQHKWVITAIGETEATTPAVVATCSECGLIRSRSFNSGGGDEKIDLSGQCPGRAGVDRTVRGSS